MACHEHALAHIVYIVHICAIWFWWHSTKRKTCFYCILIQVHTLQTRWKIVLKYRVRIEVVGQTIKRIETEHNHWRLRRHNLPFGNANSHFHITPRAYSHTSAFSIVLLVQLKAIRTKYRGKKVTNIVENKFFNTQQQQPHQTIQNVHKFWIECHPKK